jgi:Bacterial regulatory protein, arsR family
VLANGEASSGELVAIIQREFAITQAAVSQHLKVLRGEWLCVCSARPYAPHLHDRAKAATGNRRLARPLPSFLGPQARSACHRGCARKAQPVQALTGEQWPTIRLFLGGWVGRQREPQRPSLATASARCARRRRRSAPCYPVQPPRVLSGQDRGAGTKAIAAIAKLLLARCDAPNVIHLHDTRTAFPFMF